MPSDNHSTQEITFAGWYDRLHRKFRSDCGSYVEVLDCLPEDARQEDRGKFVISVTFVPDE